MAGAALLSVYDKNGILEFARGLRALGWHLLASDGTAELLKREDIACTNLTKLVGPPVLDHRVVTLHPAIHGGLMAEQCHADELKQLGWKRIELLVINLYPLRLAIEDPLATRKYGMDKTDVGGTALLRSAAKGRRLIVTDPNSYGSFLRWLRARRPEELVVREYMALEAERLAAQYCGWSAQAIEAFLPSKPVSEEGGLWPNLSA